MASEQLQQQVAQFLGTTIKELRAVSGGSINRAAKIITDENESYFLKWNCSAPDDMFPNEAKGLQVLRSAHSGLGIPEVIGTGATDDGTCFLVMEFITEGTGHTDSPAIFGRRLAALHQTTATRYGLDHDNYIGRLPQSNTQHNAWIDFFIAERLQPQLRQALSGGKLSEQTENHFQHLYKKLPDILADEPASLLHGDLWSGNYFFDTGGSPVIYDPAVYFGNREIELAFTHLFGGFSSMFYQAYNETFPIQPGFNERTDIYNLYPLLVHANLFGSSYGRQVEQIAQRFA